MNYYYFNINNIENKGIGAITFPKNFSTSINKKKKKKKKKTSIILKISYFKNMNIIWHVYMNIKLNNIINYNI